VTERQRDRGDRETEVTAAYRCATEEASRQSALEPITTHLDPNKPKETEVTEVTERQRDRGDRETEVTAAYRCATEEASRQSALEPITTNLAPIAPKIRCKERVRKRRE
jgi:hypothetical protein